MGLPARLREVDGIEHDALADIAEVVRGDSFLENGPEGFDPSLEEIEDVLEAAW
jgi:hypothetical protein